MEKSNPNKIVTENGLKTVDPNYAVKKHARAIEKHITAKKNERNRELFNNLIARARVLSQSKS